MKNFGLVAVLLLLFSNSGNLSAQEVPFDYCSPLPGSNMVLTETNIILRAKNKLDGTLPISGADLSISGSKSGNHTAHAHISEDNRTMVFQPETPFLFNETVTVSYHSAMRTISGERLPPFTFSFTTQSGKVAFDSHLYAMAEYPPETDAKTESTLLRRPHGNGDSLPPDFPPITITAYKPIPSGQMYIDNFRNSSSIGYYLMDVATNGTVLNYKNTHGYTLDFKKQPNGLLSYYDQDSAGWIVMDSLYTYINTYREVGYATDSHDFIMLPNGHVLLLGDDPEIVRMDTIVTNGNPNAVVDGIIIQELDENQNVVFQWRTWDHFNITDAIGINLTASTIDYCHSNALELDYDGNLLLSSRHLDEITKIDRSTGNIIWRWGGNNNQFTFLGDPLQFTYQHAIRRIKNGHYTLFDNGNFHNPQYSRAVEYQLDQNAKTATAVWEYRNKPDIYGSATGYVQRLDDGNTLICWGATNPNVSLIAPDSTKIFDLTMPTGIWTYRAYMYPYNPNILVASPVAESISLYPGTVQTESLKVVNITWNEVHFLVSNRQSWLMPNSVSDSLSPSDSAFFTFTVNSSGLLPWNVYYDTITLSGFDTHHSSIQIPIALHTRGPNLLVSPGSISVDIDSGLIAQESLKIKNIGLLSLNYTLTNSDTSTQSWITFASTADTLAPGDSTIGRIQINAVIPSPGMYNTTITVTNSDSFAGNAHVPVSVHVRPLLTIPLAVSPDWNLVSLPVSPITRPKIPIADSSNLFSYQNSYVMTDSVTPGKGVWMKFDSAQSVPVTGIPITNDSVMVNPGWNMIGSISTPIAISSITSDTVGMQTSPFYSYSGSYTASDSIIPGKGYWVRVDRVGLLRLGTGASALARSRIRIVPTTARPPYPPIGVVPKGKNLPREYALDQAYPSPFNPTTTIRYELPFESRVTLKIYTILGQEIETLRDGIEDAGVKSVVWNAGNYASGIYLYRLEATSGSDASKNYLNVKKVVLVK